MHIVFTVGSLHPKYGGPSVSVPNLARSVHLFSPSTKTYVLTNNDDSDLNALSNVGSINIAAISRCSISAKIQEIKSESRSPILLHDNGMWLPVNRMSMRAATAFGIPRIVSPRGMCSPWSMSHKRIRKRLAWILFGQRSLSSADLVHATSELEKQELLRLGIKSRIATIPNGVELRKGNVNAQEKKRERTVVFLSRIHEKKGISDLLKVWAAIPHNDWRLIIAGPDEQGLIEKTFLPPNCHYVGEVKGDRKYDLLESASLFVLPTKSENFGIVIAEALEAGTPVITTTGAPWNGLIEHECGWWIDPTPEALAIALRSAMKLDSRTLQQMGARGHAWVKQEFSWDSIAAAMHSEYVALQSKRSSSTI